MTYENPLHQLVPSAGSLILNYGSILANLIQKE